ncbi:MAG: tetratricopeptide repeat protein [Bacteroidetes bacterium]|nr:tetratricopeptide repeat protein [Bacteroidota bacterium]
MRLVLQIFAILFILGACTEGADKRIQQREDLLALEAQMLKKNELDTALAIEMIEAYQAYIQAYPKDSLAPQYQKKTAEMYRAFPGKSAEAIDHYERLFENYTYTEEGAKGLLSLALYYEELQLNDRAISAYTQFLTRFPSHPLASQAEQLRALLSDDKVTDIQMVQEWMKKAKKDTQNSEN